MRSSLSWTILAAATLLGSAPANAQTYDPDYPVCIQVYMRGGGYISCSYYSLAACRETASGRAAQCYANPYFVRHVPPARTWKHRHREYRDRQE